MRKQLEDFLIDLAEIYPLERTKNFDKVIGHYTDYLLQFCIGKEIDFKKVKFAIFDRNKTNKFPDLYTIRECLFLGEVTQYQQCKNEGDLLVVTLPNGYQYEFTVSAIGKSIKEIQSSIKRRYNNCTFQFYPKGTVIIGDKIFVPEQ